jgi:cyclophilin family peptidyl-prolyl cis-trans isomerase
MKKPFLFISFFCISVITLAQKDSIVTKKDKKKDVLLQTSMGDIIIHLSDSTPLHRDNFLKLMKVGFYDSLLFHRVIKDFMIQGGDPNSKNAPTGEQLGNGGPSYTVPAEIRTTLFHKKGVIAAARMGDNVNPQKASNGSQFYLAQGKVYTDEELDAMEANRLGGRKIPAEQREIYKTIGGIPHLDQNYTVYGEVINGLDVVDKIAAVQTSTGVDKYRPLSNVMIIKAKLIKRKKKK